MIRNWQPVAERREEPGRPLWKGFLARGLEPPSGAAFVSVTVTVQSRMRHREVGARPRSLCSWEGVLRGSGGNGRPARVRLEDPGTGLARFLFSSRKSARLPRPSSSVGGRSGAAGFYSVVL